MTTDPVAANAAGGLGWVTSACEAGATGMQIVAALGRRIAAEAGLAIDASAPAILQRDVAVRIPPGVVAGPGELGAVFEQSLDHAHRHSMGVHYTPAPVARRLVRVAMDRFGADCEVCDPSVGSGAFLLAAAEEFADRGVDRATIVGERLWGIDIDPLAIAVADLALALWGSSPGAWVSPGEHLVCADTLVVGAEPFDGRRFGVVVGNPPFQNQLGADTARTADEGEALRDRWDVAAGPYADTAAFFLLAALELASVPGVVALVEPESVLVSGDAAPIRAKLLRDASLCGLWTADTGVFAADVRVCAPVLARGGPVGPVQRWRGADFVAVAAVTTALTGDTWAPLIADLLGVPSIDPILGPPLADTCTATAGFRDQFYGLAAHTFEGRGAGTNGVRLVTVGMIDPLRNRWGTGEFRFNKQRWLEPQVNLDSLRLADPTLARWVDDRLSPKVLVATQTRVIEVAVDEEGILVPSTPTIAVTAPPGRLWHVAAALTSPVATALAFNRAAGAALSADTLRLTATQVLSLSTPKDEAAWDEGAGLARAAAAAAGDHEWNAALGELGRVMCAAYGVTGPAATDLLAWWSKRLPGWR